MKRDSTRFLPMTCWLLGFVFLAVLIFVPGNGVAQTLSQNQSQINDTVDRWNPGWMQRHMWKRGQMSSGMQGRMARHWVFMHQGPSIEYNGVSNPYAMTEETISAGKTLYRKNCGSCHGAGGFGDGIAANSLSPSPALLAYMIQMPSSVDEYMMWSIAEGGKAFLTKMPSFKNVLAENDIWKIITYMRAGFPN
jgi:mono/diheme cytochrome c family protein